MHTQLFLALALFLSWSMSYSQFQLSLGDAGTQAGKSVRHTPADNGFITAGYTYPGPLGFYDAHLVKTSSTGSILWTKAYGGSGGDYFNAVQEFKNMPNNLAYAAAGYTNSFGAGSDDMFLTGTDVNGNVLFTKTYGGTALDRAYCIRRITDPSGNPGLIVAGESKSFPYFGGGTSDLFLVRTDLNGNVTRSAVIGTAENEAAYWVEQTSDGGYLVAGYTNTRCSNDINTNNNIYVLKLQPNLNVVWSRIFASPNSSDDVAFCVRENTNNNTIIVTGNTRGYGQQQEAFLLNLSSAGGFLWMKTYGGAGLDDAQSLLVTNDALGNTEYIASGYSNSFTSAGNFDLSVFKTRQNGNLLWTKTYGGPGNEFGYEISPVPGSPAPNYIATGYTNSYGAGSDDVDLIYLDNSGNTRSACEKNPLQIQQSVSPCTASNAQVVFVSQSLTFQKSATPLSYGVSACFSPSRYDAPHGDDSASRSGSSLRIAPVPAQSFLNISFEEAMNGGLLVILNAQGQEVKTATLASGNVQVDIQDLSTGIYFIQLRGKDGTTAAGRFVKE